MSGRIAHRAAFIGATALACGLMLTPIPARPDTIPRLQGTFMQLSAGQRWTDARLNELFADFKRLQLSRVIVQWTASGRRAFYPSTKFESVPEPPLDSILRLADASGMKVRLGLADNPTFWAEIAASRPGDQVERALQRMRSRSLETASELLAIINSHPSFDGWFITEEIDDINWMQPERRTILRSHLSSLSTALGRLRPSTSIAISGFSNANCDPAALERFWSEILDGTGIDRVFFQDGIGARKLDLDYAPMYFAAMKRAITSRGLDLAIVIELFEQVAGPPVSSAPFRAVAAPIDRVRRQLSLAGEFSTTGIVAFSAPDYMVRGAGPSALQLFNDYTKLMSSSP